jgi:hypothetical protein
LDAGAAFLSRKPSMPIDDAEKGTLLHIGRLLKSEEKIEDLTEKAEDLWLEKERLESIAENAIAAGAPDANAAVLAADEASSTALLVIGIAMEAQFAKEQANNERDQRAQMTSVERDPKRAEREKGGMRKEQYTVLEKCVVKPARDSKLYNWTKTQLSNGPSGLDAKIQKEIAANEGSTVWTDEKLDLLIVLHRCVNQRDQNLNCGCR